MILPDTISPNAFSFIDVEASSLGRASYPIEIGWCLPDTREVGSVLVRPPGSFEAWDWDPVAEQLHGISRLTLVRDGQRSGPAARQFAEATKGRRLFADSAMDGWWMKRLFQTAKLAPPPFVEDFYKLLDVVIRPEPTIVDGDPIALRLARAELQGALIDQAYESARRTAPKRHRAGDDARHLYTVYCEALALFKSSR
jgi:hypothetical protein